MTKTKSVHAQKTGPRFDFDGVDDKYLQAFGCYPYLTALQVSRLLYKPAQKPGGRPGSFTTAAARLKALMDNGYLLAIPLPTIRAKSPLLYIPADKGRKYIVDELGLEVMGSSFRPAKEEKKASYEWFMHVLETTDALIAAEQVVKQVKWLHLETVEHYLLLKDPPLVSVVTPRKDGKKYTSVEFDGLLRFRIEKEGDGGERFVLLWLELDRGRVKEHAFKEKIRDIVRLYEEGGYEKRFRTRAGIFAFATTHSARRCEAMRLWAREELKAIKAQHYWYQRFAFTALPSDIDPIDLYLGNVWYLSTDTSKQLALLRRD